MWAFAEYVARVNPYIAVFESVQQAFSGGRELMQMLRTDVEQRTNQQWNLFHVKHNAAGCGGCAIRRRYFWVVARIPFGVEQTQLTAVPKLWDVIGDLHNMGNTWEAQPYGSREPSWWIKWQRMRSESGVVDGHRSRWNPATNRAMDLLRTGQKIFVYHHPTRIHEALIERLHTTIRRHGPGRLLYVREQADCPFGTSVPMTLKGMFRMRITCPTGSMLPKSLSTTVPPSTATLAAASMSCCVKKRWLKSSSST